MIQPKVFGRRGRWIPVVLILTLLPVWVRVAYRVEVIGRDQPIVLDDFAFMVQDVRVVGGPGDGNDSKPDSDRWMVVSLKITNRARRVSFRFDPGWAAVVDGQGVERRISAVLQGKHDERDASRSPYRVPIKAGESAEVDLVFEAPPNTSGCQFRLSSGGTVGDLLDGCFSGPRRIALDR